MKFPWLNGLCSRRLFSGLGLSSVILMNIPDLVCCLWPVGIRLCENWLLTKSLLGFLLLNCFWFLEKLCERWLSFALNSCWCWRNCWRILDFSWIDWALDSSYWDGYWGTVWTSEIPGLSRLGDRLNWLWNLIPFVFTFFELID